MNAPIILFVYNRPEHTRRTIETLRMAEGAKESRLIIFSDGAKVDSETSVKQVRKIAHSTEGFESVEVIERSQNIGLASNIIDGVSSIIAKYGKVIVLEDDLEVSNGFITYMNAALTFYEEKHVFAISGYTPKIEFPIGYNHSTYLINRNCSWGWATWQNKWNHVDWNVTDFDSFIRNSKARNAFDKAGSDLSAMLLRWKTGQIHSWSIRFCYAGFKAGEPTVYPVTSLIVNNGVDGSGTNMKASEKYDTIITDSIDINFFTDVINVDEQIQETFSHIYNCSLLRRIINYIKLFRYIWLLK